jgi:phage-related protein
VYKIPILCSECEKPTGTTANFFRCIVNEDELCQVHNEMKGTGKKVNTFLSWVSGIVTTNIPNKIFEELGKIYEFFEPIQDAITNIIGTVREGISSIKDEIMTKISTFFEELQTNISDLFSHVQTGISNFASLMYQSIDNLRTNAIQKLQLFGQQIQDKINEFIFKPVNEKVIQTIKNAFEAIGNFFNGLVEAIISPFRSFFEKISNFLLLQSKYL